MKVDSRAEQKKMYWLEAHDSKQFTCEIALRLNILQKIIVITFKFSTFCTDFEVLKPFLLKIVKFNNKTIIAFWFRSIRVFVNLIKIISTSDNVFGQYHFYQVDKNTYRPKPKGDNCIILTSIFLEIVWKF